MEATTSCLDPALEYAGYGWQVVPLHWVVKKDTCSCVRGSKCSTPGKHPYGKNWQKRATTDKAVLEAFWGKRPLANVGIQVGEASGVVDFETDDQEQEKILLDLFDQNVPVTCCFKSARGKHRLFQWRNDLPGGSTVKVGALTVRIGNQALGTMSVMPPSLHPAGVRYEWLVTPEEAPLAEIPNSVVAKLWNEAGPVERGAGIMRPEVHWERILKGVPEGSRDSDMISLIGKFLRSLADLSDESVVKVAYKIVQNANQNNCPPLSEEALRKDFLSIVKAEQNRRATEQTRTILPNPPEVQVDSETRSYGMKLVRINSEPPLFELHGSQFAKAPDGKLILTAEQLTSARAIRVQAAKQANYPLPKGFMRLWDGTVKDPGLYERLMFSSEQQEAPLEEIRHLVVAERLAATLAKAAPLRDDQSPTGKPVRLSNGAIVFNFTMIWEDMAMGVDKITRPELSQLLTKIGAKWYQHKAMKLLDADSQNLLSCLINREPKGKDENKQIPRKTKEDENNPRDDGK